MGIRQASLTALMCGLLAACASDSSRAPVEERGAVVELPAKVAPRIKPSMDAAGDWRPQMVVVQKGDTLYGIAFNYGLDYRELAELNGIENPSLIQVGQTIRLFPAENKPMAAPVEVKPLGDAPVPVAGGGGRVVKTQPKVLKLPYSEQALAQIGQGADAPSAVLPSVPPVAAVPVPKVSMPPVMTPKSSDVKAAVPVEAKPAISESVAVAKKVEGRADGEDAVEWVLPTSGKLIGEFSESANRKGVDLAGKIGQPVNASAAGKVVYSGSGLRGYGKLIIIKHNKTYLSAYAHNDKILVKEGQQVEKGQKIAEMGNSDADQPKLHFEIRRFGKPVDPAKFLALSKP